ncbi:RdgB/HAM1 family non-canonical purine NTP pyrophosphatase [Chryseosolibacter indicus]|uniref:dITP/XTP pyrophosphatase n=1 Tax=Chryseosolibacter indicus TaxID=2782351 RepID=A0ABS5VS34_9BACT|nr:RdgB/HAM1 family non-canonical purine NTP pyrophosphatase [Chryseosolibacter indicus]
MRKICFATNNQHKVTEVWQLLKPDFLILSLKDIQCFEELPETKDTLEANALQKAEYVLNNYKTPCFADDSGLEVYALNNEPGVYSARYAGLQRSSDDNMNLLLEKLKNVKDRRARFRSIIALIGLGETQLFEGIIEGEIMYERKGTGGFGYDPIFKPLHSTKTFAEMTLEEKNALSHRAIAVGKLVDYLGKL